MNTTLKTLLSKQTNVSLTVALHKVKKSSLHSIGMQGGGIPILLNFNMEAQIQSNWCWAATAKSISHFYNINSKWTQCLVASNAFPKSACCVNPGSCNKAWFLDQALSITSNFVSYTGSLNFIAIETELQANRVIGARIGWNGGGGHFMVIFGCRQTAGNNYLNIDDPIYGKSDIEESVFRARYQGAGMWTHSYYTKS